MYDPYQLHFGGEIAESKHFKEIHHSRKFIDTRIAELAFWPDARWQYNGRNINIRIMPLSLDKTHINERMKVCWAKTHGGARLFASNKQRAFFSLLATYP